MAQTYTFTKTVVDQPLLSMELLVSGITNVETELELIEDTGAGSDNLEITFTNALSGADETVLNAVVAAHPSSNTSTELMGQNDLGNALDLCHGFVDPEREVTGTTSWQQRAIFLANGSKTGLYVFNFSCEISQKSNKGIVEARVRRIDGAFNEVVAETEFEPEKSSFAQWHPFAGNVQLSLTDETPELVVEWRTTSSSNSYAARIRRVRIFFFKGRADPNAPSCVTEGSGGGDFDDDD